VQGFQQAADQLENSRTIEAISYRASQKEAELKAMFAERESFLQSRLAEKDQFILSIQGELSKQRQTAQAALARVAEFEASRLFQLARLVWRVRLAVAPHGSFQERAMQLSFRSVRVLRREGLGAFLRAIPRKIRKVLPASQQISAPHETPAQILWQTPSEIPIASKVDIVIFPIIDWDFRFQRPQQIATQLAANGHRVFYIQAVLRHDKNVSVRTIRENIFECQLPSIKPLSIYMDTLDKASVDVILDGMRLLEEYFNIQEAVSLVDLPFWGPAALALRVRNGWKVVYDCMDLHKGFSTNQSTMLEKRARAQRKKRPGAGDLSGFI